MAAQGETYAVPEDMGRLEDQQLVDNDTLGHLQSLVEAQVAYDSDTHMNDEAIAAVGGWMSILETERERLINDRDRAVDVQGERRVEHEEAIMSRLSDPDSGIHPIFRAILLAPYQGNGSLYYSKTLAHADRLGRGLVALDDHIRAETEPNPVVEVRQRYRSMPQGSHGLQLSYGFTVPGEGMTPHTESINVGFCSCGVTHNEQAPKLELPLIDVTTGTVRLLYSGFLATVPGQTRIYEAGGPALLHQDIDSDVLPIQGVRIPIPTGNYFDSDERLALYDQGGVIAELRGPSMAGTSEHTFGAIGGPAIRHVFDMLQAQPMEARLPKAALTGMIAHVADELGMPYADPEYAFKR